MKVLGVVLLTVLLVGCGGPPVVESELKVFIDDFAALAKVDASGISAKITDDPSEIRHGAYGVCDHGTDTVIVNRRVWPSMNEHDRRVLMYHELSHCLLGVDHVANTYMDRLIPTGVRSAGEDVDAHVRAFLESAGIL